MRNLSIRLRLTLWYSAVLLVGLASFCAAMWFALGQRLASSLDTHLEQRAHGLRTVLELESRLKAPDQLKLELSEFAREVPEGALMWVRDSRGESLLPDQPVKPFAVAPGSDSPAFHNAVREGKSFRLLTTNMVVGGERYAVLVATSTEASAIVLTDLRNLLFLMIPVVLLVACLGGYWISSRALRPVDEITRVARSISVENLSRRLEVPRTGDELQRMSETWNEVLNRLEGAVKRIGQFTADASHELRSPIALIRATADLSLRRERPIAEYQKALSEVRDEADRMTELTESLLTLARSDAERLDLTLAPVDVNGVIRGVVRNSQNLAVSKGVSVITELVAGVPAVMANSMALARLLLALLDNAIKYTPAGGTVVVATSMFESGVVLSVRDTGEGIKPEALPHIFERFFRVDPARSSGSGVGLGLPIAQALAHAHGSHISVASTPGAGSRFEVKLRSPVQEGP